MFFIHKYFFTTNFHKWFESTNGHNCSQMIDLHKFSQMVCLPQKGTNKGYNNICDSNLWVFVDLICGYNLGCLFEFLSRIFYSFENLFFIILQIYSMFSFSKSGYIGKQITCSAIFSEIGKLDAFAVSIALYGGK